jgi:hypothetical protein
VSSGNVVIVVGGEGVQSGIAPVVRDIAERTDIGVFNTWTAKGLFAWNHPAHLGTIGLQAEDIALAGLGGFDEVVLCGVDDAELPRAMLDAHGVRWRDVLPGDLAELSLERRSEPTSRPALYVDLAAVVQPLYADASLPINPARIASDLAAVLPEGGVVAGDAGRSGFWIGRTFPTRVLGSVQLPSRPAPGFAAMQAVMARRTGRFSVAVVDGLDDATLAVIARAKDLVIEIWADAADVVDESAVAVADVDADQRLRALADANRSGGVHVQRIVVRNSAIEALVAVAGAPLWEA